MRVGSVTWSSPTFRGVPLQLQAMIGCHHLCLSYSMMTNLSTTLLKWQTHMPFRSQKLDATPSEIRLVIAILLVSGYVPLVNRRMYWENSEDVHNAAVSSTMPVNCFEKREHSTPEQRALTIELILRQKRVTDLPWGTPISRSRSLE